MVPSGPSKEDAAGVTIRGHPASGCPSRWGNVFCLMGRACLLLGTWQRQNLPFFVLLLPLGQAR